MGKIDTRQLQEKELTITIGELEFKIEEVEKIDVAGGSTNSLIVSQSRGRGLPKITNAPVTIDSVIRNLDASLYNALTRAKNRATPIGWNLAPRQGSETEGGHSATGAIVTKLSKVTYPNDDTAFDVVLGLEVSEQFFVEYDSDGQKLESGILPI